MLGRWEMRVDLRAVKSETILVVTKKPATMAWKIVMAKLIFRLFFSKEFRMMARARQELERDESG